MSTDVNGAAEAGKMFHEAWAKLFELVLGIILLVREVKWLAPLPFIIIICKLTCVRPGSWCSSNLTAEFGV